MKSHECGAWSALCALVIGTLCPAAAPAQTSDVKDKPPMYTYVSNFTIPRARWADMDKQSAADDKIFEKALGGGGLIGYGNDTTLVHETEGATHDSWWSAMSMAAIVTVLDDLHKGGASTAPVLSSATKHNDNLYVSKYYSWKSGSVKDGYIHGAYFKLKADAPDDALDTLSKGFLVPMLEKWLADGTIVEYEIDTEAIHTETPGAFWIFYITQNAGGLDKATAALREALKTNALAGPAFGAVVDFSAHRDYLGHTNAIYK